MKTGSLVMFAAAMFAHCAASRAATVTLVATRDASIFSNSVDNASGGGNGLFAGTNSNAAPRRALVAFELAAIPASATVQSAQLKLTLAAVAGGGGGGGTANTTVRLHRLTSSWSEGATQQQIPPNDSLSGAGQGAPALAGDVTWNARQFSSVSPTLWSQPGGDFATASSSLSIDASIGAVFAWPSTPALVSDVQGWLAEPATNAGWLLAALDEATASSFRAFYSSDVATAALRPTLTITYTNLPAPSADFDADGRVDGDDFLTWQRGLGIIADAPRSRGDANGDGAVNKVDLAVWRQQFASSAAAATAVPEPTAWLLLASGALAAGVATTTRRRRA